MTFMYQGGGKDLPAAIDATDTVYIGVFSCV